jgi:UDP-galactopyranose mutase
MTRQPDVIVFSHLRWDFVWQRPQHLLTRLAADRRVFFVEEPIVREGESAAWELHSQSSNVFIYRPLSPVAVPGFQPPQHKVLRPLLRQLLASHGIAEPVIWFYTPLAFPLAKGLRPRAIVYDCMDELSAFRGAPAGLVEQEAQLLRKADVVFTGGPSLYRARQNRHPNIHCIPSSVDVEHFGKARRRLAEPEDQASLNHPRLGFFGVIDERFDIPLLDKLARSRPNWQFMMIGPVVKIDPRELPKHPNIHYTGARNYASLPAYLSGWDVCLLPFARNDSTRFISPTKTLEYMAAEKPIVSTPIADVIEPYGHIVYHGKTSKEFLAACESALHALPEEKRTRTLAMRKVLAKTSWDATAETVRGLIDRAVASKSKRTAPTKPRKAPSRGKSPPVVVIGAGPTGLSAAYQLGRKALLLEQNDTVGGCCRSLHANGFTFDYAGHIMFSNDTWVHKMYRMLLGDNVHWQDREAWIYSKGVHTRYPFQGALHGLPPDVIKECLVGAIEARFGPLSRGETSGVLNGNGARFQCGTNGHSLKNGNGRATPEPSRLRNGQRYEHNGHSKHPQAIIDCCGDGIQESTVQLAPARSTSKPLHFEEFIYQTWGAGIAKHFAIPYNRKLWAVPLTEMETSWLGGRVPMPDLGEMIDGALRPAPRPMGPNARFGYPLRGGFQALMDGFLPHLRGPVRLNARVASISPSAKRLTLHDGSVVPYKQLINTMPLPVFVRLMGDEAPSAVRRAAAELRYVSVCCVHLGIGREKLTDKHWIYYPEDTVFHRVFVQGNASPHCNPPGGFGLTCEITYCPRYKPLPCDGESLIQRCIDDCRRVGLFTTNDPIWASVCVHLPHAYVVYDHARPANVATIRAWLEQHDIQLAGRYAEWEYYNSDHAFLGGKKAAETARQRLSKHAVKGSLA